MSANVGMVMETTALQHKIKINSPSNGLTGDETDNIRMYQSNQFACYLYTIQDILSQFALGYTNGLT